jgi:hypothetical protein
MPDLPWLVYAMLGPILFAATYQALQVRVPSGTGR